MKKNSEVYRKVPSSEEIMPPNQNLETQINGNAVNGKLYLRNGSLNNNPEGKLAVLDKNGEKDHCNLQKRVGLLSGVCLIVGTMIGSGIFISPKGVLAGTGSVGLSLIVWVGCGIISLFGALSYAELGTLITKSGAEYAYLHEAFGPFHKTLGPVPAFLFAWTSVLILKPALFGVVSMSFALYTTEPFFECGPPDVLVKIVAIVCLFFVSAVNCYSVKLATKVQNVFTVAKLVAIAVITIGGFVYMGKGEVEEINTGFEDTVQSPSLIALAFYDGLWAYDGWNNLNYITEEIRNPTRNLPLAIMIGIPLVTLCYLLTNLSYYTVMTRAELLRSTAVAATWGDRVLGGAAVLIPIFVAMSTFGAANGSCFTGGRLTFVAAREGHLPKVLSYVHIKKFTPLPSLMVSTFLAAVMVLMGDIFALIDFFSFTAWLFYGSTMAALLVLRYTKRNAKRPYKVPIILPITVLCVSVYLVIAPIVNDPRIEFLYAFIFVISGLIFYVPFVVMKKSLPYTETVTKFIQLILWCAPSRYESELVGD
ncbi:b(0,+)-type amino acid transporter 1-like isoform X2 [Saccostrea echinata]|uniref:b(0,+)-type amino acid transporter 1-like isoform X2 n=1 Tax=Saccostrea echinata TaxID=191078 RepID=UPI002A82556D|nr:b(0,+)-type amino acid transporter 1-like isoform X2 [Saccostrea echinata]